MTEDTLELVNDLHLEVTDLIDFLEASGGLAASGDGAGSDDPEASAAAASPWRRLHTEARDLARRTEALDGPDHAVQTQAERIQRRIERIYQEARSRATTRTPERRLV